MNAPVKSSRFIPSWTAAGRVENLADPASLTIDFAWISATLSGLARFNNKQDGSPLSVAQHCVMGADALFRETGDAHVAGLFLLHDAHEAWLGDITTPVQKLIGWLIASFRWEDETLRGEAMEEFKDYIDWLKLGYDERIYAAACQTSSERWSPSERRLVRDMDARMAEAEAWELFGPHAFDEVPRSKLTSPKLVGSVCPVWGAMKAEEAFNARLKKYCGIDVRLNPYGIGGRVHQKGNDK